MESGYEVEVPHLSSLSASQDMIEFQVLCLPSIAHS